MARIMVVTGAASGIGEAITLAASEQAAHVLAVDRNAERLAQLPTENVTAVEADLLTAEGIAAVVSAVDAAGGIDVLINNAGIMDGFTPVSETSDDLWSRVIGINLTAPMQLMRAFIPKMADAGGGAVINIASSASLVGGAAGAAYTASKHGVIGLTRNAAVMYAVDGVRVNAICPGGVSTNIAEAGAVPAVDWAWERLQGAMGRPTRMANAQDIAATVLHLAAPEAINLNGSVIASDGGWTAA